MTAELGVPATPAAFYRVTRPNKGSLSKGLGGVHISAYRAQNPAAVLPRRGFALALPEIRWSSLLPRGPLK
jgi:hypothetical protein